MIYIKQSHLRVPTPHVMLQQKKNKKTFKFIYQVEILLSMRVFQRCTALDIHYTNSHSGRIANSPLLLPREELKRKNRTSRCLAKCYLASHIIPQMAWELKHKIFLFQVGLFNILLTTGCKLIMTFEQRRKIYLKLQTQESHISLE